MAKYAVANGIDQEPAFKWWVPYVPRKWKHIISKVKAKYWQTTHKYGVKLPKNVKEALHLNDINGNTFWCGALNKEPGKTKVAYEHVPGCAQEEVRENKVDALRGFQEITCHVIFDVKMDFTRKACFVANGSRPQTTL